MERMQHVIDDEERQSNDLSSTELLKTDKIKVDLKDSGYGHELLSPYSPKAYEEAEASPESTIHASLGTCPRAPLQTFAQATKRLMFSDVSPLIAGLLHTPLSHFLGIPEFWDGLVYGTIVSVGMLFVSDKRPTFARFLFVLFSLGHVSYLHMLLVRFLGIEGPWGELGCIMIVSVVSPLIIITMNNYVGNPMG